MNDITVRQTVLVITYIRDKLVYACVSVCVRVRTLKHTCVSRLMMYVCMHVRMCTRWHNTMTVIGTSALLRWEEILRVERLMRPNCNKQYRKKRQKIKNTCYEKRQKSATRTSDKPAIKINRFTNKFKWNIFATAKMLSEHRLHRNLVDFWQPPIVLEMEKQWSSLLAAARALDTGDWISWWLDGVRRHNNRIWPEKDAMWRLLRHGAINIHATVSGCSWQMIFVALFSTQVEVKRDARQTTKELKARRKSNFCVGLWCVT